MPLGSDMASNVAGQMGGNGFGLGPSFAGGLGQLLSGLFNDASAPYDQAMGQYQQYANQAAGFQRPYDIAGQNALGRLGDWLGSMKNPTDFVNSIMSKYQASPYSQYLQQQAQRAGTNAASASGLIGSTPFQLQSQENAANIASGDMNQWLQNVLGINTQYGQGQEYLSGLGANAANQLSKTYNQLGSNMAEAAYGKEAGKQQNSSNLISGILGLFGL